LLLRRFGVWIGYRTNRQHRLVWKGEIIPLNEESRLSIRAAHGESDPVGITFFEMHLERVDLAFARIIVGLVAEVPIALVRSVRRLRLSGRRCDDHPYMFAVVIRMIL
jgi:hypothetical protein